MHEVRSDEPRYAFLWDKETKTTNRYGQPIELTQETSALRGQSLNINDDSGIGENPHRYKQHGFFLNADNCIGCHACESACSEKNDNPPHIAFRSVGYVEGGTYPNYQRLNISMACNHCDDPVCLKGCPTRAYTKFAEYGAVLQDPDICFGCGYCTWVCPYNAPQLDPVKGQVTKCNMCVDRLEVGLKPACVTACLGNALDFGVIENIPAQRDQAITEIPGFPTTEITRPNIRFQQKRQDHREMTRTDSAPIKYHKDVTAGRYKPVVDAKSGHQKHWNFRRLLTSHESAHVIFTLTTQAAVGAFLLLIVGSFVDVPGFARLWNYPALMVLLSGMLGLGGLGLFKLNMHLGKPHRFYRGFNNLKLSPVSREIAGVSLFFSGLAGFTVCKALAMPVFDAIATVCAGLALLAGPVGLYYMYRLYRIPARPFWNHWQTGTAFWGSMLSLGALLIGVFGSVTAASAEAQTLIRSGAAIILVGLLAEAIGHVIHARDMQALSNEGAASFYKQVTEYGYSYWLRNALLLLSMLIAAGLLLTDMSAGLGFAAFTTLTACMLIAAIFSRSLFFVLVIPTTMPGAFFWKNDGFVQHARETGLADAPQHGVVYERHHAFKLDELMQTVKEHSLMDMIEHAKSLLK